jgi:hypothetical protein
VPAALLFGTLAAATWATATAFPASRVHLAPLFERPALPPRVTWARAKPRPLAGSNPSDAARRNACVPVQALAAWIASRQPSWTYRATKAALTENAIGKLAVAALPLSGETTLTLPAFEGKCLIALRSDAHPRALFPPPLSSKHSGLLAHLDRSIARSMRRNSFHGWTTDGQNCSKMASLCPTAAILLGPISRPTTPGFLPGCGRGGRGCEEEGGAGNAVRPDPESPQCCRLDRAAHLL